MISTKTVDVGQRVTSLNYGHNFLVMVQFVSYLFTRQQCQSTIVASIDTSSSLGILIADPSVVCSPFSDGLELDEPLSSVTAPRTKKTLDTLHNSDLIFSTDTLVVEMWLGFEEEVYSEDVVILDIGPETLYSPCESRLRIEQKSNSERGLFKFSIIGLSAYEFCVESYELTADFSNSLNGIQKAHYFVFSITENDVTMMIDGNSSLTSTAVYKTSNPSFHTFEGAPLYLWLHRCYNSCYTVHISCDTFQVALILSIKIIVAFI